MATFRDFPWRKVPGYIFAQVMGGVCGAGIIYANYIHAIDVVEGGRHIRTVPGTANLFSTYAVRHYLSLLMCCKVKAKACCAAGLHDFCILLLLRG